MFYLRLNKAKILNNREAIGRAEIQLMSFITTGDMTLPDLNEFFKVTKSEDRIKLIKSAVSSVISSRIITPVYKVKDNHQFTFGDAGFAVYKSENIPNDINWQLIAIEQDERTRTNAELVKTILTNENINTFVDGIVSLAGVANPPTAAVIKLTNLVAQTVTDLFKNDKDDQVGLFVMSLNRREHYLNGIRDKQDISDLTGNMFIDYSIFAYENGVV